MIVDSIENIGKYQFLPASLKKALELLKDKKVLEAPEGKCIVDGDNIFYIVLHYDTKPIDQCKIETHKNYIDVQFVVSGEEMIGYYPAMDLQETEKYNPEKDVEFYKTPQNLIKVNLTKGMFGIFWPHDGHMPCAQMNEKSNVHKIVFKVRV